MEDENKEVIDSTSDTDTESETTEDSEETKETETESKFSERETKLYARAKRAEAEAKAFKARLNSLQTNSAESKDDDDFDVRETVKRIELSEKKRTFGYENSLSPEETDYLYKISSNPTKELLEDPFIKGGLQALRAKKRVAQAIPSSSGRTFQAGGKTWDKMDAKERAENFEARMKSLAEKNRK